jgi:hypothetical protein
LTTIRDRGHLVLRGRLPVSLILESRRCLERWFSLPLSRKDSQPFFGVDHDSHGKQVVHLHERDLALLGDHETDLAPLIDLHRALKSLSLDVLAENLTTGELAELGRVGGVIDEHRHDAESALRCFLYTAPATECEFDEAPSHSLQCVEHRDTSVVTVMPASGLAELEVFDEVDGRWVRPEEGLGDGDVVVLVGTQMGMGFKAPLHRVIHATHSHDRISTPFFARKVR